MFFSSAKAQKRATDQLHQLSLVPPQSCAEQSRSTIVLTLNTVIDRISALQSRKASIEAELAELTVIREALAPAVNIIDGAEATLLEAAEATIEKELATWAPSTSE